MKLEIWQRIIEIIGSILAGSSLSYLLFYKQKRAGEDADAVQQSGVAMAEWFKLFNEQQELLKTALVENETYRKKVMGLEMRVSELERQLAGMQRTLDKTIILKEFAEKHICLDTDCLNRKPAMGTYKNGTV